MIKRQIKSIEKIRLGTVPCDLCESKITAHELEGYEIILDNDKKYILDLVCGSNLERMLA